MTIRASPTSVNLYTLDSNGIPVAPSGILSTDATYHTKKDADYAKGWNGRAALLWKPNESFDVTVSFMGAERQIWRPPRADLGHGRLRHALWQPRIRQSSSPSRARAMSIWLGRSQSRSRLRHADLQHLLLRPPWRHHQRQHRLLCPERLVRRVLLQLSAARIARPSRGYGDKAFIQELRLVSEGGGPIDYVFGLYYQNQQTSQLPEQLSCSASSNGGMRPIRASPAVIAGDQD